MEITRVPLLVKVELLAFDVGESLSVSEVTPIASLNDTSESRRR